MPLDADAQHLGGVPLPPVLGGENLDLAVAAVAGALDHGADRTQIDHAVAHHAPVEQKVLRRKEPVVDVVGENFFPGAPDLSREVGIPPHMISIDHDARALAQFLAEVVRLRERVHAGAIGRIHRMQRLDPERHPRGARVGPACGPRRYRASSWASRRRRAPGIARRSRRLHRRRGGCHRARRGGKPRRRRGPCRRGTSLSRSCRARGSIFPRARARRLARCRARARSPRCRHARSPRPAPAATTSSPSSS